MSTNASGSTSAGLIKARIVAEVIANIVIVVSLVVAGLAWVTRNARTESHSAQNGNYAGLYPPLGSSIDLPGINWTTEPETLIIAISSECPHCINESSFYSALTRSSHHTPIFIVMPQQIETARSFLEQEKILPSRLFSADFMSLRVRVTPTIMLISPAGLVMKTWVGELDSKQKQEIIGIANHS